MASALTDIEQAAAHFVPSEAIRRFTDLVYALDGPFTDQECAVLEQLIDRAVRLLAERADASHREFINRLLIAREGIEQGISPDPDRRPSVEDMRQYVAARL